MLDLLPEPLILALAGLFGGTCLGLAARLGRFCTLGAIEDQLYGGSTDRLRMWAMAIGLSVTGTFALSALGYVPLEESFYLSLTWMPLSTVLGGLLFGYGMAMAGNCGYGALARLGGGDLRAFVIVLVMGITAYATISGPLAYLRAAAFPQVPAAAPQGMAHALASLTGLSVTTLGLGIGLLITAAAAASRRVLNAPALLGWAALVALGITSAWALTGHVAQEGFSGLPPVSHSFSAPLGETLLYTMTGSSGLPGFAVGSVSGVLLGAFLGSLFKGHFRWEACEDPRELKRQMLGAALMGIGAVLAMGCSVGQGLSAMSTLAYSAPLAAASIYAGVALGLRHLIEGFQPAE